MFWKIRRIKDHLKEGCMKTVGFVVPFTLSTRSDRPRLGGGSEVSMAEKNKRKEIDRSYQSESIRF